MQRFFRTKEVTDRRQLLEVNQENVELIYTQAQDDGLDAPVVFVLDLRYEKAATLAEAFSREKGKIQKMIDGCAGKEVIPTVIGALTRDDAQESMGSVIQNAQKVLSSTVPRGYFRVVVVAFGGHMHCACQQPRSPALGPF